MTLWILVADAALARVAEVSARKALPRLIHTFAHPLSRAKGMDIVTDRPGSVRGSFGAEAMGPTTPPKQTEAEEFARQLTAFLGKQFDAHQYDALAILAPARFMGLLRTDLAADVEKSVVFEDTRDLTFIEDSQLPPQLMDAVDASFREVFARTAIG